MPGVVRDVPYFVTRDFDKEYKGRTYFITQIEKAVVEEYAYLLRNKCSQEREKKRELIQR
jgi:hypothetical protein